MTPTEVITLVQNMFGDKYQAQVKINPDLIGFMNAGQTLLAKETECLQTSANFSTTAIDATQGWFTTPADLLRFKSVVYNNRPLKEVTFEHLVESGKELYVQGDPVGWYKWGSRFFLWPVPPATGTNDVVVYYQNNPPAITTNYAAESLSIPVHMHEDLAQYMLMRCQQASEDRQGQQMVSESLTARLATNKDLEQNPSDRYPVIQDDWMDLI